MSKLLYIQILRAGAALSVAILHAQHDASTIATQLNWPFQALHHIPWGAGVDVFFVISGFIIVHSSQKLFETPHARRVFLTRRLGRVVPLYWTATTLYLTVALVLPGAVNSEILDPGFVLSSYVFIPVERSDGLVQPLYSLGWTLNYEMFFYAIFALVLVWPKQRGVLALIAAMVAAAAIGRIAALPHPLGFWTDPIILEFAFGMALALLKVEGLVLSRGLRAALVIGGIGLLVLGADAGAPRVFAYGVPASLLVAAAALGADRARANTGFARMGSALGDASYALYLIHPFVIRAGREVMVRSGLAPLVGPWGYIVLVLAGAVLASLLVFRWYERPLTEWIRQCFEPAKARLA
jgi:exopolysaccharide production protein ExoZ